MDIKRKFRSWSIHSAYLILIFTFLSKSSTSQSYFVRNYSLQSGIPTRYVSDVTQDSIGRMWFATSSGISIYDGFQWKNLDKKNGLPSNQYVRIKTDEKGIVWCISNYMCEPIIYFKNDSLNIIHTSVKRKTHSHYTVTSFDVCYEKDKPVLCIGTSSGLFVYKDNNCVYYDTMNGLINNLIYNISSNKNKFYITTPGGVVIYKDGKFDNSLKGIFSENYSDVIAVAFSKRSETAGEDEMWVLGKDWVGIIENNKIKVINDKFLLPSGKEIEHPSLVISGSNLIFFGNFYFTYFIERNRGELFPLTRKQGFNSDGCTSIFIDKENNMWQTGTRGIDKVSNLGLVNYYKSNGMLDNEVTAILEYSPGKFIFGHNNGLTIYSREKSSFISFPENKNGYPGDSRVMDICKATDGVIWLACSSGGVGKLENYDRIKWIKFKDNNAANAIGTDKNGEIWVGTNEGMYIIRNDKLEKFSGVNIKDIYIRRVFFFNDDESYFASSKGLVLKKGNTVKYFTSDVDEMINNVYAVFKDSDNRVLAGTSKGLYIAVDNGFKKFTSGEFKIDNAVYAILKDKSGTYWFGTDDGIIKWGGGNQGIVFTKDNGLSGRETNRAALIEDSKNNIWIGTESGLTCFGPYIEMNSIPNPKIYLLNAEDLDGNKYGINNNTSISYNNNTLSFNFRAVSFYAEDFIQYKVKLEGIDEDWYIVNQPQIDKIRYTNLIPGDYRFLVSARNFSGTWSGVVESSVITIEKPFYKRWWFYLLSFLVFAFLLYHMYKLYIVSLYQKKLEQQVQTRTAELKETEKALRKSQSELEEKVIERTSELAVVNEQLKELNVSKDKFFSIIAHDMKSPFTGLLGYTEILKNEAPVMDKDKIVEYSENLYKNLKNTYNLLENLLNWASLQTGRMAFNPEKTDLFLVVQNIIDLLKVNASSKNINLKNNVSINTIVKVDINMIRTVLYNLVSNGIKFTNRGGEVMISSDNINGIVEISVKDNGVGIPKEYINSLFKLESNISTRGTEMEKGTGLGLLLCKEMIEKHNGKISVESKEGKGTIFKISLYVE